MDKRLLNEIKRSKQIMGIKEGLNLPKANQNVLWQGVDSDLLTSLDEYGFVARQPDKRDSSDEWFILYKVTDNAFDTGWKRESELDNIILGNEWADAEDDIPGFLNYVGMDKEEWLSSSFVSKLHDLIGYWGLDNILGTSYHQFELADAISMINEYSGKSPIPIDDNDD